MNDLGTAVRFARIAVGRTQWQMARVIGIHPGVFNNIELGRRALPPEWGILLLNELQRAQPVSPFAARVLGESIRLIQSHIHNN